MSSTNNKIDWYVMRYDIMIMIITYNLKNDNSYPQHETIWYYWEYHLLTMPLKSSHLHWNMYVNVNLGISCISLKECHWTCQFKLHVWPLLRR